MRTVNISTPSISIRIPWVGKEPEKAPPPHMILYDEDLLNHVVAIYRKIKPNGNHVNKPNALMRDYYIRELSRKFKTQRDWEWLFENTAATEGYHTFDSILSNACREHCDTFTYEVPKKMKRQRWIKKILVRLGAITRN